MSQDIVEDFERRFGALNRVLEDAQANLRSGRVTDLQKIETEIALLCKKVEGSPPEVAKTVQPLMGEMIARLDALAQDLMDFKQQAAGH